MDVDNDVESTKSWSRIELAQRFYAAWDIYLGWQHHLGFYQLQLLINNIHNIIISLNRKTFSAGVRAQQLTTLRRLIQPKRASAGPSGKGKVELMVRNPHNFWRLSDLPQQWLPNCGLEIKRPKARKARKPVEIMWKSNKSMLANGSLRHR